MSFCEPEVEDFDDTVRRHSNVDGLQITMDNSKLMGVPDGFGELHRNLNGRFDGKRAALNPLSKRFTLDVLHYDVPPVLHLQEIVDHRNAGMIQPGYRSCLEPDFSAFLLAAGIPR